MTLTQTKRDGAEVHLGVEDTDFGTREFATLDLDGNLVPFFKWRNEP